MIMSNETPKSLEARKQLFASFSSRICPLLSISGLQPSKNSPLVTNLGEQVNPASGEAIACQGTACAWFCLTRADDEGNPFEGSCALTLIPSTILRVSQSFSEFGNVVGSVAKDYRVKPRS